MNTLTSQAADKMVFTCPETRMGHMHLQGAKGGFLARDPSQNEVPLRVAGVL